MAEPNTASAMATSSAWIGVAGVVVGALLGAGLTLLREWIFHHTKVQKDRAHLAILVSAQLDRFVMGCAEVVDDNGLWRGQPDKDGNHVAQTTSPTFEPGTLDVEWKSLPVELMHRVLDFPFAIEQVEAKLQKIGDDADPPEYAEWFDERQFSYAKLGDKAATLADELRAAIGIPMRPTEEWRARRHTSERLEQIERRRRQLSDRHFLTAPIFGLMTVDID